MTFFRRLVGQLSTEEAGVHFARHAHALAVTAAEQLLPALAAVGVRSETASRARDLIVFQYLVLYCHLTERASQEFLRPEWSSELVGFMDLTLGHDIARASGLPGKETVVLGLRLMEHKKAFRERFIDAPLMPEPTSDDESSTLFYQFARHLAESLGLQSGAFPVAKAASIGANGFLSLNLVPTLRKVRYSPA